MPIADNCPQCGHSVDIQDAFCSGCGFDVSGEQDMSRAVTKRMYRTSAEVRQRMLKRLQEATLGEYEVLGELGTGGMATVFVGHDLALNRKVALKVMSPLLLQGGPDMVERFRREARTAASLSHPNIIPIYAVKEAEDFFYFVMKFVEGRTLGSIIRELGRIPIKMATAIFTQVGSAIGYAHRQGVIHRDLKPDNIMIDTEGWAVVTDFGIAKVTEAEGLTMTGVAVGTPVYMSPEQSVGDEVGGASDQYSLGVVTYEMLAGRPPFSEQGLRAMMYAHLNENPPSLLELRPECPPVLAEVVHRMLGKTPGHRFPSVDDAVAEVGATPLPHDDPVRTDLVNLAKTGASSRLLATIHTPTSPAPLGASAGGAKSGVRQPSVAGSQSLSGQRTALRWVVMAAAIATAGGAGWWFGVGRNELPAPVTADPPVIAPAPAPSSVALRAPTSVITVGSTIQLSAVVRDGDGNTMSGAEITWQTSDPSVATVSSGGVVTAVAEGTVEISVGSGAHTSTVTVGVRAPLRPTAPTTAPRVAVARVQVDPSRTQLVVGDVVQLVAALTAADGALLEGRAVRWTSANPSVASVSSFGRVTALAAGNVRITARVEGRTAASTITVEEAAPAVVAVSGASGPLDVGETVTLVAVARSAGGDELRAGVVVWSSSAPAVVDISSAGVARAVAPGRATISATVGPVTETITLEVRAVVREPVPPPDPRPEIDAAVDAYIEAFQSGDLAAIQRVYPSLPADQVSAFESLFQEGGSVSTRRIGRVQVNGNTARQVLERTIRTREGPQSDTLVVILERRGTSWRIVSQTAN